MKRLENKVAIITGSASGIGLETVKYFASEGAKIIATDVRSEILEKEIKVINDEYKNVFAFKQDVSSEKDWTETVNFAINKFGTVDILVNNAGIVIQHPVDLFSIDDYDKIYRINQFGVFLGIKTIVPVMKKAKKGSIVNISSISGIVGQANNIAYNASKFAVRGMTKAAAVELGPFGIRVNSIHPGIIKTPMTMNDEIKGVIDELSKSIPLQRLAEPGEVATLCLYLASDESSYATGSEFIVDGGMTAN